MESEKKLGIATKVEKKLGIALGAVHYHWEMLEPGAPTIYQLHVSLIGISPMIWRRIAMSGE